MPSITEIEIPVAELTGGDNKSVMIPLNNAQRATLIVQASANPSAGEWALRVVPTNDVAISGDIVGSAVFPATPTPARVTSVTVEVAQKYAYVEQIAAITGATLEKVVLYLQ
jgi:hypothetical protein